MAVHAQFDHSNVFASLSGYRNTGFKNNLFTAAELGLNLWSDQLISPEISVGFMGPRLPDQVFAFQEGDDTIEQQIRSQARALLLSAGFNIKLPSKESYGFTSFLKIKVLPEATFTASLFEGSRVNSIVLKETISSQHSSLHFDFGLGVEGFFDDEERWSGSLSLVYTTQDTFNHFKGLEFTDARLNINFPSQGALGLRFLARYHFKKTR